MDHIESPTQEMQSRLAVIPPNAARERPSLDTAARLGMRRVHRSESNAYPAGRVAAAVSLHRKPAVRHEGLTYESHAPKGVGAGSVSGR